MAFTHVIRTRKALRHVPHHHRGPALNKCHAVAEAHPVVRDCQTVTTACGGAATVSELCEVVGADGGPVYNCWATADAAAVTCKDCRKKLGL